MSADASPAHILWFILAAIVVIAALLVFWVLRKGRLIAGPHVFRASRLSRDNRLFPAQVVITPTSLTLYKPQWIGKLEESIHMAHIASIKISTHMMLSDITIETSGGQEPVICHGHLKGDAVEMKRVLEQFQSDLYKNGGAVPSRPPSAQTPTT
jgi:hypothetical protein